VLQTNLVTCFHIWFNGLSSEIETERDRLLWSPALFHQNVGHHYPAGAWIFFFQILLILSITLWRELTLQLSSGAHFMTSNLPLVSVKCTKEELWPSQRRVLGTFILQNTGPVEVNDHSDWCTFIFIYLFALLNSGRHMPIYYVTQTIPFTSLSAEFIIYTYPFVQYVTKPV